MEENKGILSKLTAPRRPILEMLKEKQARHDAYQKALDEGDYNGESELGSTVAERRADMEAMEPGMDEGNVGFDENLTQKILNFLRTRKLRPVGREDGSPVSLKSLRPSSPLPQPAATKDDGDIHANF